LGKLRLQLCFTKKPLLAAAGIYQTEDVLRDEEKSENENLMVKVMRVGDDTFCEP
jgi:hypothetical protein